MLMSIFGAHRGKVSGEVYVEGRKVSIDSPSEAIEDGIGFVTEDRKRFGLILDQTISAGLEIPFSVPPPRRKYIAGCRSLLAPAQPSTK